MFCKKCGSKMGDGAAFCPQCGWKAGESHENPNNGRYENKNESINSKDSTHNDVSNVNVRKANSVDDYNRGNESKNKANGPIYVSIDVIKYNDMNMVESIETYWTPRDDLLLDFTPEHLDDVTCEEYVYYKYDKNGNLIEEEGRAPSCFPYTYTYEY